MKNKIISNDLQIQQSKNIGRLSNEAIQSMKDKYFEVFGIKITDDDANVKGIELLQYFSVVYRPIPKEN